MKNFVKTITSVALVASMASIATADPVDDNLVLNEEVKMVTRTAAPAPRAMQADDFDNPGMIFVEKAEEAWNTAEGSAGKSCASCHEGSESMKGVRTVYPKWNEAAGEVRSLEMQINDCRENQMGAKPWKYSGGDMVNMTALISSVSRGLPMSVAIDGPAKPTWEMEHKVEFCTCTLQGMCT